MKRAIVLAVVATVSQAMIAFAGPEVPSKAVVAPPPPPPPEFFRPNEFDIGAFGTYATGVGSSNNAGKFHLWGGGMDFTYWFPWLYLGARFQGTGGEIIGGGGPRSKSVTLVQGFPPVTVHGGGGDVAAGILESDLLLRYPLDKVWPGVHLAPYMFVGFGGVVVGSPGENKTVSETFTVTNSAGVSRQVTFTGRRISRVSNAFGNTRLLGDVGGGLEYRFTPNIGIFGETGYYFPNGAGNNFVKIDFGLRYAF